MSHNPDDDGIVTTSITITRRYWPNDPDPETNDTILVNAEGQPTMVEALGLLEFAKLHWVQPADPDVEP